MMPGATTSAGAARLMRQMRCARTRVRHAQQQRYVFFTIHMRMLKTRKAGAARKWHEVQRAVRKPERRRPSQRTAQNSTAARVRRMRKT